MRVTYLNKTCDACPTQWEGHLDTGEYLYIRFRWGWLSASIEKSYGTEQIYSARHGDEYSGLMSTDDMTQLLSEVLDFSVVCNA